MRPSVGAVSSRTLNNRSIASPNLSTRQDEESPSGGLRSHQKQLLKHYRHHNSSRKGTYSKASGDTTGDSPLMQNVYSSDATPTKTRPPLPIQRSPGILRNSGASDVTPRKASGVSFADISPIGATTMTQPETPLPMPFIPSEPNSTERRPYVPAAGAAMSTSPLRVEDPAAEIATVSGAESIVTQELSQIRIDENAFNFSHTIGDQTQISMTTAGPTEGGFLRGRQGSPHSEDSLTSSHAATIWPPLEAYSRAEGAKDVSLASSPLTPDSSARPASASLRRSISPSGKTINKSPKSPARSPELSRYRAQKQSAADRVLHVKYKSLSSGQKETIGRMFQRLSNALRTYKRLRMCVAFSRFVRFTLYMRSQEEKKQLSDSLVLTIQTQQGKIEDLQTANILLVTEHNGRIKQAEQTQTLLISVAHRYSTLHKSVLRRSWQKWIDVVQFYHHEKVIAEMEIHKVRVKNGDVGALVKNYSRRIAENRFKLQQGFVKLRRGLSSALHHRLRLRLQQAFCKIHIHCLHVKFRSIYISAVDPLKDYIHYQEELLERVENDVSNVLHDRSQPYRPTTLWSGLGDRNTLRVAQVKLQQYKKEEAMRHERAVFVNKGDYSLPGKTRNYDGSYTRSGQRVPMSPNTEFKKKRNQSGSSSAAETHQKHHPPPTCAEAKGTSAHEYPSPQDPNFNISSYYEQTTDELLYPLTSQLRRQRDEQRTYPKEWASTPRSTETRRSSAHKNDRAYSSSQAMATRRMDRDKSPADIKDGQIQLSIHSPLKINDFNVQLNLDTDALLGERGDASDHRNERAVQQELSGANYSSARMQRFYEEREKYGDAADTISVDSDLFHKYSH